MAVSEPVSGVRSWRGLLGAAYRWRDAPRALLPAALDQLPQIRLVGVEAARVAPFSPGLSASVAARLDEAAAHIREAWR